MKKLKSLLSNWSLSDNIESNDESNPNLNECCSESATHLSIGENKDAEILRVGIHPDAFFANSIELYDEPPLMSQSTQYKVFPLQLKQYSPQISFNVTISPKLCELGCVRVNSSQFVTDIEAFNLNLSLQSNTKRDYLYIPMMVELPTIQQRHGLFDDLWSPTLMVIPLNPRLYRYKLTDAFIWRYQYVRIREYTSLKMDVIGEIPSALSFEIIGYPVRAILPNYMRMSDANVIEKTDLLQRKSMTDVKQWTAFENSFWIKLETDVLSRLPLMRQCIDKWKVAGSDTYFEDKGYIIQQYLGHTVLECIGPILSEPQRSPIVYIESCDFNINTVLELKTNEDLNVFDTFPSELIAHIISFCDFQFVHSVLCSVSSAFYHAAMIPSCYHTAMIPSTVLHAMLSYNTRMLTSLTKCARVNIYSLVFEDDVGNAHAPMVPITAMPDYKKMNRNSHRNECYIEQLHLEFITDASLHLALFNTIHMNHSLKVLKLTQCNMIDKAALTSLPDQLEELSLMNTVICVDSWSNLKHLRTLIITKSANLHSNNASLLQGIIRTLPKQILECICVWDDQEENKPVLKQLVQNHNQMLKSFVIGGRICLYHPFSSLFTSADALWYPRLEMITVSCLSTNEIKELVQSFGHQLRILEMYCPFVMEQEQDIYQWLLDPQNIHFFCASLTKLEILMCQAFPHHMKRYMTLNKWRELRNKFEEEFSKSRKRNDNETETLPLILFDFGIDLNKIRLWCDTDIKRYLIQHQKSLELNFGEGV